MKIVLTILLIAVNIVSVGQINTLTPGAAAPEFELKNVDGKLISFNSMTSAKGYIVVFTCNTCPYSQKYEQRLIDLNEKYTGQGYPVIAINPNDPELSPGDSFDKMVEEAKAGNYKFPYLFDPGQKISDAYGAKNTPQIFLVNKTSSGNVIVYTGAIDNDPENIKSDKINYVETAIAASASGKDPETKTTKAIGCTVKRKKS